MSNLNNELKKMLGQESFNKLSKVKVGIAGAGGLGSNVAVNLVRSGFKGFKIVDFDKVEASNLNRQFYFSDQIGQNKVEALKINLLRISNDLNLDMVVKKIEKGEAFEIFSDCDILVEAFDKAEYKAMLVSELLPSSKLIVSASGLAGYGNSDELKVNKIKSNLYIVGDGVSGVSDLLPPISPRVNVAAAKMADIILTSVLENNEISL